MGIFDPRSRTNDDLQKEVDAGKIDAYKRTDNGGIQKYVNTANGDLLIKDVEPADNSKGHHQTDFVIQDERIVEIKSHKD